MLSAVLRRNTMTNRKIYDSKGVLPPLILNKKTDGACNIIIHHRRAEWKKHGIIFNSEQLKIYLCLTRQY
jgi:hypothetical protein